MSTPKILNLQLKYPEPTLHFLTPVSPPSSLTGGQTGQPEAAAGPSGRGDARQPGRGRSRVGGRPNEPPPPHSAQPAQEATRGRQLRPHVTGQPAGLLQPELQPK